MISSYIIIHLKYSFYIHVLMYLIYTNARFLRQDEYSTFFYWFHQNELMFISYSRVLNLDFPRYQSKIF